MDSAIVPGPAFQSTLLLLLLLLLLFIYILDGIAKNVQLWFGSNRKPFESTGIII
jgi:hypothetical protein